MTNTLRTHPTDCNNRQCPLTDTEVSAACEEFVSITNTSIDIAMMMLQQNEWNLERAVSAHFNSDINPVHTSIEPMKSHSSTNDQYQASSFDRTPITTNIEFANVKTHFKLLSWNIDGLDKCELESRTQGVIDVIKREEPDAVFLQEVIPTSLNIIRTSLPQYNAYIGNTQGYFVVILTRQDILKVLSFELIAYPGTSMGRNLLVVHATYRDSIDIDFMTSHHESGTQEYASNERMKQLSLCFKRMLDAPPDRIILFGGDLNMRERELRDVGNIPSGISDVWIETGKQKECEYTWDMVLNSNNNFSSSRPLPRARFDRLYFRASNRTDIQFKPITFELKGLNKLPSVERFCSDHWAIQACFNV